MSNILYVLNLIFHSAALNFIDLNQTHKVFASLYLFTKLLLNYCLWKLKWLKHILFLPNRWVAIPWHHRANCLSKSTCFGIPDALSRPMFRRTVSSKVLNNASKTKLNHLIWRRLQIRDVYFPDSFKLIEKRFTLRAKSRKIRWHNFLVDQNDALNQSWWFKTICTSNQMSHSANKWSFRWSLSWVQNHLFAPLFTLGMVNPDAESISCETMLANTVLNS